MNYRICGLLSWTAVVLAVLSAARPMPACCPVFRSGKPVVNADQTVMTDDRGVPYRLHIFFAVDRDDDAKELRIVDCRLTSEATGEN